MAPALSSLSQIGWNLATSNLESRDYLINFWLSAPLDQLETLWFLPFGSKTKDLVRQLTPSHIFSDEQIELRNTIGARLSEVGLRDPLSQQLMLVNFLLSPPGLLTINNIDTYFPEWLVHSYLELYEKQIPSQYTADPSSPASPELSAVPPVNLDFGPFPATLADLVSNRIHLNRLLGLSNLYFIDPDDDEIRSELMLLRLSLANAIDNSPESDLESYFATEFGDRYWSLVRSGIQKEILSSDDQIVKQNVVQRLNPDAMGGFGTPKSINAFLIAMMYFLPGTMNVPEADTKLPAWILPFYKEIFMQ